LMAPGGSASTTREVSAAMVATEKAVEMRTTEEAAVAKAAEEAAAAKVAADKAAVAKATADAAAVKTADQGATTAKTTVGSVGSNSVSSPTPAVGSKRDAASGGSTPSMRFCGA
jgi:membrane protein involved in colicin uptake